MNLLRIYLFSLLFASFSHAAFERLLKGYLGSKVVMKNAIDHKIVENNLEMAMASNPWQLSLSSSKLSNDLDTANPFQGRGLVVNVYSLALAKNTFGYGTFSFTHTDNDSDFTDFTVNPNNLNHIYEKRNSLAYSFDFLDRSNAWDYEVNIETNKKETIQNQINQITNDANFMQAYLKAKFDLFNLKLKKEFAQKSKIRLNRISKMFKDGAVRKVDYLQAKLKFKTDQRGVKENRLELDRSLLKLEALINAKVPEAQLAKIKWEFIPLGNFTPFLKNKEIKDIDLLSASLAQLDVQNKKSLDKSGHKLALELKYESNILKDSTDELLEDSFRDAGGENRQVSLTYSIGFGSGYIQTRKKSAYGEMKRLEIVKQLKADELNTMFTELKKSLDVSQSLILGLKEESKLAKLALKDMSKLYDRGQATFSDVITSQETLLSIESQKVRYLYQYETSLTQYFTINGEIRNYMSKYQD
jgi:outer membrane protein TolC